MKKVIFLSVKTTLKSISYTGVSLVTAILALWSVYLVNKFVHASGLNLQLVHPLPIHSPHGTHFVALWHFQRFLNPHFSIQIFSLAQAGNTNLCIGARSLQ